MLKGISKIVSPELLKVLCEMGHGDEIVIADGIEGIKMLEAVLSLIPLDTYAKENFMLMQTVKDDPKPDIWETYFDIATKADDNLREGYLERFEFYERAKQAYAIIATGEKAVYANIIIKKGVVKQKITLLLHTFWWLLYKMIGERLANKCCKPLK